MNSDMNLRNPWLVAAWPGMGNVALAAGHYLVETLGATQLIELRADDHFEQDRVRIKGGVTLPVRAPKNVLYGWKNPNPDGRDLLIFLGEAQPSRGALEFSRKLLHVAREHGVEQVFTFASMVTPAQPAQANSVFTVANRDSLLTETDELAERLSGLELTRLQDGEIVGLNGLLLAASAELGLSGRCFLGEVPQIGAHVPYFKASLGVLRVFTELGGIELDTDLLEQRAEQVERGLNELLQKLLSASGGALKLLPGGELGFSPDAGEGEGEEGQEFELSFEVPPGEVDEETEAPAAEVASGPQLPTDPETLAQIESLFLRARDDRGAALELKETLDRLEVFELYEDRFLDLFSGGTGPNGGGAGGEGRESA